jgi:exosortase/archaeosortase family protein
LQILYHACLLKIGIPDHYLTNITAIGTCKILSIFYPGTSVLLNYFKAIILINGEKVIGIADVCNALEIFVLYIAFLICYPSQNKRRIKFLLIGIPCIYAANIIRCSVIAWLNIEHRGWVEISHHYIFNTLVYCLVFYLWVLFSKGGLNNES